METKPKHKKQKQKQQQAAKDKVEIKSNEEVIMSKPLENVEETVLGKVFDDLTNNNLGKKNSMEDSKSSRDSRSFGVEELKRILDQLEYQASKGEIEQMIWEVDDNLDGRVDYREFQLMYKKCKYDTTGLEPRSLNNLVQFLMYLKPSTSLNSYNGENEIQSQNEKPKIKIKIEDTLYLLVNFLFSL